ncbi:MAG TPA: hypothetical protein VJP85_08670 [Candidatus Baltobacteraceae bacterium]|nr:hypothetical protein [Candidatus Baltobacteraceae bacterium]
MDYIIGAGAILETGESGTITPATLHANVDAALARRVRVAAVDFEGTSAASMQRLLILAQGWSGAQFRTAVTERLRVHQACTLADVLATLALQADADEVHVFAHWLPDEDTCAALERHGISLVSHPLESISAASLVAGQRLRRWAA